MQKLIIQDIEQLNAYTYAIRFSGTEKRLNAMNGFLRRQSRNKAYYDNKALNGIGAWIMKLDFLRRLSAYFANVDRSLVIADRKAVLKKMRTPAH